MKPPLDLTGQRFGRLVVLQRGECDPKRVYWLCLCDCGAKTQSPGSELRRGKKQSCGCLRDENRRANTKGWGYYGLSKAVRSAGWKTTFSTVQEAE